MRLLIYRALDYEKATELWRKLPQYNYREHYLERQFNLFLIRHWGPKIFVSYKDNFNSVDESAF
jgi:hypothetical protein